MQWLDCEQSEQDKRYVEVTGRSTRERWQRMVEVEKQEEKRKEQQEEIHIRWEIKEREAAAVSYGPPWAHYLGGYQDRLLGGPLGLLDLCRTVPVGVRRKDYGGEVLG
jgi:hypothetical protein